MKVARPKWGSKSRPERITFTAPAGTRKTLMLLAGEIQAAEGVRTQLSDAVLALINNNIDCRRIFAEVKKEGHDTSNDIQRDNTEATT